MSRSALVNGWSFGTGEIFNLSLCFLHLKLSLISTVDSQLLLGLHCEISMSYSSPKCSYMLIFFLTVQCQMMVGGREGIC